MAFGTRRTNPPVLTRVSAGGWEELNREGPRQADRGWDEVTLTLVGYWPGSEADGVILPAAIGDHLGVPGEFYVAGVGPLREWGGHHYLCDIYGRGLLAPRVAATQTDANAELFSGATPGHPNTEALVCTPAFEEEYIASYVPTDTVGTAVGGPVGTGGSFPATPANPWVSISDPTWHYPHGWIHESCVSETLEGTGLHLIRNRYRFQFEYTP